MRGDELMGLFDDQVREVRRFIEDTRAGGKLTEFDAGGSTSWPPGSSLVLEEDTALELGNPSVASLCLLIWTGSVEGGAIRLVGPDVRDAVGPSIPFAQVVIAGGDFTDEYECYRDLRDAVYDTKLEGFMTRTMPSRRSIWCRLGRGAFESGFSLGDLGSALIARVGALEAVTGVEVLFVTSSPEDVERLEGAVAGAQRKIDAMMKMYQEKNFDCETCEYRDVCESVLELKVMRKRLSGEEATQV